MIFLGKIIKTKGNKGEVVVSTSPDFLTDFVLPPFPVTLKSVKYTRTMEVRSIRDSNGSWLFHFNGVDSIGEALKWIGYEVFCDPVHTRPVERESVLGFSVYDAGGALLGYVQAVDRRSLNVLLEVRLGEGDETTLFIPFVPEIVRRVDRRRRELHIDPPPGLLELNI